MIVIKGGKDQDGYWEWVNCKECRFVGKAEAKDVYYKEGFWVDCPCCKTPLVVAWAGKL